MDGSFRTLLPNFAQAIGGKNIYDWLKSGKAFEQIMEQGYAELALNPAFLNAHAPNVYRGMEYIINSSLRDRYKIALERNDEFGEDVESGLMYREDDESKFQLHWFLGMETILRRQGAPVEPLMEMFTSTQELDTAAFHIACNLALLFDEFNERATRKYEGCLAMRYASGLRLTRILDYQPHIHRAAAPDAKAHIDRCGFTSPHWESTHPGLVLFDRNGKAIRANETDRGTVLIFPDRKMGIIGRNSWFDYAGTVHGVRDEERSTRSGDNRRAIVSFVHPTLTREDVRYYTANKKRFDPDPALYPI